MLRGRPGRSRTVRPQYSRVWASSAQRLASTSEADVPLRVGQAVPELP